VIIFSQNSLITIQIINGFLFSILLLGWMILKTNWLNKILCWKDVGLNLVLLKLVLFCTKYFFYQKFYLTHLLFFCVNFGLFEQERVKFCLRILWLIGENWKMKPHKIVWRQETKKRKITNRPPRYVSNLKISRLSFFIIPYPITIRAYCIQFWSSRTIFKFFYFFFHLIHGHPLVSISIIKLTTSWVKIYH
jgi:hypothetical protein